MSCRRLAPRVSHLCLARLTRGATSSELQRPVEGHDRVNVTSGIPASFACDQRSSHKFISLYTSLYIDDVFCVAVTKVKVGQTVGYGPQRDSCGSCSPCHEGIENCCTDFEGLYDPKFGGYATSITVPENFTFPIPEGIPLEVAGPLLCAGVTTYAPLARFAKKGDKVRRRRLGIWLAWTGLAAAGAIERTLRKTRTPS